MQLRKRTETTRPSPIADILEGVAHRHTNRREKLRNGDNSRQLENAPPFEAQSEIEESGRYDFDLAEFPLFRLCKAHSGKHGRDPLVYADQIKGRDGSPVNREWKVYPGPFGFGG